MTLNFYQANLRGRSFKGQNLTGADFSNANIQGVDFSNATLTGANFSHTKAGLTFFNRIFLICVFLIHSALSGLITGYAGVLPGFIASLLFEEGDFGRQILSIFYLCAFVIFTIIIIRRGLGASLGIWAIVVADVTAIIAIKSNSNIATDAVIQVAVIAFIVAGILVGSLALLIFLSIARSKAFILFTIPALAGAICGVIEGVKGPEGFVPVSLIIIAFIVNIGLLRLSSYIGIRAMAGDKKYNFVRGIANAICAARGTSFRGANLTDADFTQANLKHADFRKANLTRTCWFEAKNLDLARIENTYLENPKIRQLVTTKNGEDQDFSNCDLRGLNLKEANLQRADLMGANLSESSLIGADLTEAIIAKAKLYGVNLSEACLTDACIEGWAISTDLVYDNISCDAIYMKWVPPKNPQDRKPDRSSETFQQGDFADFIFPYIDRLIYYTKADQDPRELGKELRIKTIDLYHSSEFNEFNSSAALIALKELAEENPKAELEIVSLRVLGQEKVHLKIAVRGEGDCNQLSENYWIYYKKYNKLSKQEIQQTIEEISRNNDKFANLFSIFTLPRGDSIINVSVGRDMSGVLNIGTITGDVSNAINQTSTSSDNS